MGIEKIAGMVMPGGIVVTGRVSNLTSAKWERVNFDAILLNSSGAETASSTLFYSNFGEGQSFALKDGWLMQSFHVRNGPAAALRLKFSSGSVAVSYRFKMLKPGESEDLRFDDAEIESAFTIGRNGINFTLRNKTDEPIKIDWNQGSYIDEAGTAHPITHSGVKYTDAAAAKPASTIPPSAKLEDVATPADAIYFTSGEYGGWRTRDLLPRTINAPALKGSTIALYLPLEVNGRTKNYLFRFLISDASL